MNQECEKIVTEVTAICESLLSEVIPEDHAVLILERKAREAEADVRRIDARIAEIRGRAEMPSEEEIAEYRMLQDKRPFLVEGLERAKAKLPGANDHTEAWWRALPKVRYLAECFADEARFLFDRELSGFNNIWALHGAGKGVLSHRVGQMEGFAREFNRGTNNCEGMIKNVIAVVRDVMGIPGADGGRAIAAFRERYPEGAPAGEKPAAPAAVAGSL